LASRPCNVDGMKSRIALGGSRQVRGPHAAAHRPQVAVPHNRNVRALDLAVHGVSGAQGPSWSQCALRRRSAASRLWCGPSPRSRRPRLRLLSRRFPTLAASLLLADRLGAMLKPCKPLSLISSGPAHARSLAPRLDLPRMERADAVELASSSPRSKSRNPPRSRREKPTMKVERMVKSRADRAPGRGSLQRLFLVPPSGAIAFKTQASMLKGPRDRQHNCRINQREASSTCGYCRHIAPDPSPSEPSSRVMSRSAPRRRRATCSRRIGGRDHRRLCPARYMSSLRPLAQLPGFVSSRSRQSVTRSLPRSSV